MNRSFLYKMSFILFALFLHAPPSAGGRMAWKEGTPALRGRTEVAVASLNGKIYLIGGYTRMGVTRKVEMFDPVTKRWSEKAKLPVALHHAGAAAIDGTLYVVGGFEGFFSWKPSGKLWAYDPKADRWETKPMMPTPRGALGVGVLDGKLYAIGGLGETSKRKKNVDANEVYDPADERWEIKTPLPKGRDHLAVAVLDGKIHAIGGRLDSDYHRNLAEHDVYDRLTDRWSSAAPLPAPRSGIAAAVLRGSIYVFGGEGPRGTFSDNDAYRPSTDQWESAPPMPTARHGLGAAAVGGKIYVIAGGPRPGGSLSKANEIFQID